MDAVGALNVLRRFVAEHGTQHAAAQALNVTDAYLSDILNGRRGLSDTMLDKLGLAKEIVIRKKVVA